MRTLLILALLAGVRSAAAQFDSVEEYQSPYNTLIIVKKGTVVEMHSTYNRWATRESAIDTANPTRLLVPYTRFFFAASLVAPDPKNVLMVGLGGGGFNRVFNETYPDSTLTTAEIDQEVLNLAKKDMAFQETDRNKVVIRDGRSFIRRTKETYDWILLDAFRSNFVPPHLKTLDFYQEIAKKLAPGGVMLSNLHDDCELYYYDIATITKAFTDTLFLKVSDTPSRPTNNVVVLAANLPSGTLAARLANPPSIANAVWKREIDITLLRSSVIPPEKLDRVRGRVMTDDFAPADYYKIVALPHQK